MLRDMEKLTLKEMLGYIYSAFALVVGFGLTIAGFIVEPLGVVHESVLWILGQCLIFSGAVVGISMHTNTMKEEIKKELKEEEEEKLR